MCSLRNLFKMVASFALLGILRALTIDNQLTLIKNDCYERLAIGHRLGPKDVYKTSNTIKTATDCRTACTQEDVICKSFSFGIGVKGNTTCELSSDPVKETVDLKPIGTIIDNDFDLYIKKLGCKLVLEPKPHNNKPPGLFQDPVHEIDTEHHNVPPYLPNTKPIEDNYAVPQNNKPQTIPAKPQVSYDVSEYERPSSIPPRPQSNYERPQPVYKPPEIIPNRPDNYGNSQNGYEKPSYVPNRPSNGYDNTNKNGPQPGYKPPETIPNKPQNYGYEKPNYVPNRPSNGYDNTNNNGPSDESYNVQTLVSISSGNQQLTLHPVHEILIGEGPYGSSNSKPPGYDNMRPIRPSGYDNVSPLRPNDNGYMRPIRPSRPRPDYDRPHEYDNDDRPHRPHYRPDDYDSGPDGDLYDSRPDYSRPIPDIYDRPLQIPNRPLSYGDFGSSYYDSRPNGYDNIERPFRPNPDSYFKPLDLHRPNRYGSYIPHPNEYLRPRPDDYYFHDIDRYDKPRPIPPSNNINAYDKPKPEPSGYSKPATTPRPSYTDVVKPNTGSNGYSSASNSKPDNNSKPNNDPNNPNPNNYNTHASYGQSSASYGQTSTSYGQSSSSYGQTSSSYGQIDGGYGQLTSEHGHVTNSYGYGKPNYGGGGNSVSSLGTKDPHVKPIITQTQGPYGQTITSIITELDDACFRRALAGKRVSRGFIKRSLLCESVEDCQRECADEKHFVCEGFNYRLDPSGRGKGECELLEVPLPHLDIGRDLYPDRDYDYYERDRNAASTNCRRRPYEPHFGGGYQHGSGGGGGGGFSSHGYDGYYERRPSGGGGGGYGGSRWNDDRDRYERRPPRPTDIDRRYDYNGRPPYDDGYGHGGNRRQDLYHHTHHSQQNFESSHNYHYNYHYTDRNDHTGYHYLPPQQFRPPHHHVDGHSFEPYSPPNRRYDRPYNDWRRDKYYTDRQKDRDYWGFNKNDWGSYGGSYGNFGNSFHSYNNRNRYDYDRKNYYLPPKHNVPDHWGLYGGTYGNGGYNLKHSGYKYGYGHVQKIDYWDVDRYHQQHYQDGGLLPPYRKPSNGQNYLPLPPRLPSHVQNGFGSYAGTNSQSFNHYINSILPAEPRIPTYNFLRDECSLRTSTGFKLHRGIVKKFYAVPNIYECEILCFKERDFPCASYAFRYTISLDAPSDNCYLSDRNYKELDYYTDVEPDRNFDIYTMNNQQKCTQPAMRGKDDSDCFWRVRSGQRLDHKVVRDSLNAKTIVECQLECIRARKFTCRAFSFRYGSPTIGGAIDNCQLTDWPFYELDPRVNFLPEPGFEVYERGSFGHGCEPDHFGIRGKHEKKSETQVDQLCYIGFGSPARLLPQSTRKTVRVQTELECKAECSKAREGTLFQCMSFSFRAAGPKAVPNCELSDILQRDLLPRIDYAPDPDSWLFAWDNYNPECIALAHEPIHSNHINSKSDGIEERFGFGHHFGHNFYDNHGTSFGLDTWKVYSVSGWPCRRGTKCRENREAGFWYCELEGGDSNTWDYCCRPDHQCGYSEGFPYQWCYVGPTRTQWRKCSDRYYPYIHNYIDRIDFQRPPKPYLPVRPISHNNRPYLPLPSTNLHPWVQHNSGGDYINDIQPPAPGFRPGIRPDRPPARPSQRPVPPSLDEYEMQFDNQFLEPPKPGGFGPPRHWPLQYLHKDLPPNNTDSEPRLMKMANEPNNKYAAIQNLINVIKSNDLENIQYHITNESNKDDDILFVRIPLPTNFTQETAKSMKMKSLSTGGPSLQPVDVGTQTSKNNSKRSGKSLSENHEQPHINKNSNISNTSESVLPTYKRGVVTRTKVSTHGRRPDSSISTS